MDFGPEIRFLEASARYLSKYYDEPFDLSLSELTDMMSEMRECGVSTWTSFRDHILMVEIDDDWSTDWYLMCKVSNLIEFTDESESLVYGFTDKIDLPGVLDYDE